MNYFYSIVLTEEQSLNIPYLLLIYFSRAILAFTLLGLLALVTFGPSLLGAFGGGSGSGSYGNYNRNGFDYYE